MAFFSSCRRSPRGVALSAHVAEGFEPAPHPKLDLHHAPSSAAQAPLPAAEPIGPKKDRAAKSARRVGIRANVPCALQMPGSIPGARLPVAAQLFRGRVVIDKNLLVSTDLSIGAVSQLLRLQRPS